MTSRLFAKVLLAAGLAVHIAMPGCAETQTPSQAALSADPLSLIAWMPGTWTAQLTPPGGQHPTQVELKVDSVLGGKALSFTTSFGGVEQYKGLFAYDPGKKAVGFWYPSADGELTAGTLSKEADYILLDFTVTDAAGTATPFRTHMKQSGPDDYDWTLFSQSGMDWKPLFSVHYHRKS